jgi:hypothetical protein
VSSMSQSSPSTQRRAESLPLSIPHSKSSHGPRFCRPTSSSVRLAVANAGRSDTPRVKMRRFQWRLYQICRNRGGVPLPVFRKAASIAARR